MSRISLALALALAASAPSFGAEPGAFSLLKGLVKTGNRYAGAPKRAQAIKALRRLLEARGLAVEEMPFDGPDPKTGRLWPMVNLIGRFRPKASCRFILGTHFDTRHVAEQDADPALRSKPIPGANDGSSGVAALLSLASRFDKIVPPGIGVDLVLFDGEEMGYPDVGGYCAGSQVLGRKLKSAKAKPAFGIVLDMVCAPEGVYKIEPYSKKAAPELVEALWSVGQRRLPQNFTRDEWPWIGDDHVPLSAAGVPSVLLIGMDYKPWHTQQDMIDKCSPKRLEDIEWVLEEFIKSKLSGFTAACKMGHNPGK